MNRLLGLGATVLAAAAFLYVLSTPVAGSPPMGVLLDPLDGLYRTARRAEHPAEAALRLPALEAEVTVVRDERGVPHIFARSDRDAVVALGYVVAQDRLFQMDFMPRAAAGRLAEALGPRAIETDRFLRGTGMEWAARRIAREIQAEGGLEYDVLTWFAAGANAYLDGLADEDLPFEFRLLGYRPDRFTPLHTVRLVQYMTFDLSYRSDDADYAELRRRLGDAAYERLYPRHSRIYVPIIPGRAGGLAGTAGEAAPAPATRVPEAARTLLSARARLQERLLRTVAEGFVDGKGSNNWAVAGARSTTGAPILAGDMHLNLSLPSLWYEVHLVTPTMNTYGVTFPGAPLPVEAFNDHLGWTFTNTGSDQIDHYALELDETGRRYRYRGAWVPLEAVPDTILVKGAPPVVDTLRYAHWGPVLYDERGAVAIRWMGHERSRLVQALWGMNHARSYADFEEALRFWDSPMQNILYADVDGNIAIRAAGRFPVRKAGHGVGLLDGSTDAFEWTGRIPFEDLPHARNPAQGYLASTNQQPTDSLYPYYLGHDWRAAFRSLRIDTLLSARPRHSVEDLKRYQADVHAVQRDLLAPLLDTLQGAAPRADTLRRMLVRWDGEAAVDRPEPLVLDAFLASLEGLAWDEPDFGSLRRPGDMTLLWLLREEPRSRWLDVASTPAREDAAGLLRLALEAAADSLTQQFGWGAAAWRWGDHHRVVFRHLTRSEALRPLWRGPMAYPGFQETLSPAGERLSTHSASWRVVLDFSQRPPRGYGIYPGGQSGHPFSRFYDLQVPAYVRFEYYDLLRPRAPDELGPERISSRMTLRPGPV